VTAVARALAWLSVDHGYDVHNHGANGFVAHLWDHTNRPDVQMATGWGKDPESATALALEDAERQGMMIAPQLELASGAS